MVSYFGVQKMSVINSTCGRRGIMHANISLMTMLRSYQLEGSNERCIRIAAINSNEEAACLWGINCSMTVITIQHHHSKFTVQQAVFCHLDLLWATLSYLILTCTRCKIYCAAPLNVVLISNMNLAYQFIDRFHHDSTATTANYLNYCMQIQRDMLLVSASHLQGYMPQLVAVVPCVRNRLFRYQPGPVVLVLL